MRTFKQRMERTTKEMNTPNNERNEMVLVRKMKKAMKQSILKVMTLGRLATLHVRVLI